MKVCRLLLVTELIDQAKASFITFAPPQISNVNIFPVKRMSSNSSINVSTINGNGPDNNGSDAKRRKPSKATTTDTLEFLSTICGSLKNIKRTGWVRSGIPLPESDADHMHRCAMCAMLVTSQATHPEDDYSGENGRFHPDKLDGVKLLRMAVTHDLCESIAGDVTPFCDKNKVANKHDFERKAMEEIRTVVGDPLGEELFGLWKEYEELQTTEAVYCKDIDKFEMVMQAYEYEKSHLKSKHEVGDLDAGEKDVTNQPLRTFFITTQQTMKSPLFKRLDAELRVKREAMLKERGWDVTEEER